MAMMVVMLAVVSAMLKSLMFSDKNMGSGFCHFSAEFDKIHDCFFVNVREGQISVTVNEVNLNIITTWAVNGYVDDTVYDVCIEWDNDYNNTDERIGHDISTMFRHLNCYDAENYTEEDEIKTIKKNIKKLSKNMKTDIVNIDIS